MKRYSLGFAFDLFGNIPKVALVTKSKPANQAGKLNGVGGHIEPGETPIIAMDREWREETGIRPNGYTSDWVPVEVRGDGRHYELNIFAAFAESRYPIEALPGEPVAWYALDDLANSLAYDTGAPRLMPLGDEPEGSLMFIRHALDTLMRAQPHMKVYLPNETATPVIDTFWSLLHIVSANYRSLDLVRKAVIDEFTELGQRMGVEVLPGWDKCALPDLFVNGSAFQIWENVVRAWQFERLCYCGCGRRSDLDEPAVRGRKEDGSVFRYHTHEPVADVRRLQAAGKDFWLCWASKGG